jgi:hypothetical protein
VNKNLLSSTLLIIMMGSFAIAGISLFAVQADTNVSYIIASNTTWTKANSPYNLTGPVLVKNNVTLTIEAGATVNLNGYYIEVNGTLIARGTQTNHIQFSYGLIKFMQFSIGWNEQTGSGSIIENADLSLITIQSASPKINSCSIVIMSVSGSPVISDNHISDGINILDGSPIITNNQIKGSITIHGSPTLFGNTILTPSNKSAITINSGAPVITNNIITGGGINGPSAFYWWELPAIEVSEGSSASIINNKISGNDLSGFGLSRSDAILSNGQSTAISKNTITGDVLIKKGQSQITDNIVYGMVTAGDSTIISNNTITWTQYGIVAGGQSQDSCIIANNRLYGGGNDTGASISLNGKATVENNYITVGIYVSASVDVIIRNNTIVSGVYGNIGPYYVAGGGIYGSITSQSIIIFNNLEGGIYLTSSDNVNASYNWWGTTDAQAISQSIHDFEDDFNLGTVNFIPFLTAPNPQAMPDLNTPTPTPTPEQTPATSTTPTPTPTPSEEPQQTEQLEIIVGMAIAAAVIGAGLGLLIYLIKRK